MGLIPPPINTQPPSALLWHYGNCKYGIILLMETERRLKLADQRNRYYRFPVQVFHCHCNIEETCLSFLTWWLNGKTCKLKLQLPFLQSHPELHISCALKRWLTSSKKWRGFSNGLPLKIAKKQGEVPLPILSLIPFPSLKSTFYKSDDTENR